MLRRIKRFLGLSAHSYFPNKSEVAPTADGSMLSTASRKSTKAEKKQAKKDKKKSLLADTSAPAIFHVATQPSEIVNEGDNTIGGSEPEADRQTVITDSLPYREPSDKVDLDAPSSVMPATESTCSNRSVVGSDSIKSRMESMGIVDGGVMPNVESVAESVYSADFSQDTDSQNSQLLCDSKSRELPVDCDIPNEHPPMEVSPIVSRVSTTSSIYIDLPKMHLQVVEHEEHDELEEMEKKETVTAMKKFNDELDGLLKTSAPPFQVSTARLPPMLKELPPPAQDDSMLSGNDEFDDSKNSSQNNSVARILNETHESMMRSPENKHLRSCGY